MPTLPDYLGVSRIRHQSIPVSRTGHHISRIKSSFELFCALVWDLAHVSSKLEFFLFVVRFLGHFCSCLVTDKDYFWHQMKRWSRILIVCTSCKTLYNVLSHCHICRGCGRGGGGGSSLNFRGGVVKKRESPDFRSPEVGVSAIVI